MPRVGLSELFALGRVITNGQLLRYPRGAKGYTHRFETRLAEMTGASHVLTVNSGTNALITALAAAGIGPGDEVLVPAYTWMATAIAPLAVGAVPVLVDIDETLTMDPLDIERRLSPYTKAIIPVHMLNLVCNMDAIMEIARRNELIVIEDAAQAVGVSYKERRTGSIGHLGAYSFNHFKNITSGEGGAVLTSDRGYFERARMYHDPGSFMRGHGEASEPLFAGLNFRVSELTGAVLWAQLAKLDPFLRRLRRRHPIVARTFADLPNCRLSPHNDPENAVALSVIFDDPEEARVFGRTRGAERLLDTDRHVFVNWEAVLSKRAFHPKMNPHAWANREITYLPDDYARTLEILSRTCRVSLGAQYPLPVMQWQKRSLRNAASRAGAVGAAVPA
ncbi:DegT/DnrJ/EryC1/StrS family aminotransferase (plasmid) [Salipiger sp. H15]|uniref:DegT/DnrJ/EryC1/StrS family aminotransferase n=1 Tax=Alloyangia sp. H15 TaxID=3029062 RepID=A0AAU8AS98_9RHOB